MLDTPPRLINESAREEAGEHGPSPAFIFISDEVAPRAFSRLALRPTKGVAFVSHPPALTQETLTTTPTPTPFHGRWRTLLSWGVFYGGAVVG